MTIGDKLSQMYEVLSNPNCKIEDLEQFKDIIFSPQPWFKLKKDK